MVVPDERLHLRVKGRRGVDLARVDEQGDLRARRRRVSNGTREPLRARGGETHHHVVLGKARVEAHAFPDALGDLAAVDVVLLVSLTEREHLPAEQVRRQLDAGRRREGLDVVGEQGLQHVVLDHRPREGRAVGRLDHVARLGRLEDNGAASEGETRRAGRSARASTRARLEERRLPHTP